MGLAGLASKAVTAKRARTVIDHVLKNGFVTIQIKDPTIRKLCYWADPTDYDHVAMEQVRRLDLEWTGDEAKNDDAVKNEQRTQAKICRNL